MTIVGIEQLDIIYKHCKIKEQRKDLIKIKEYYIKYANGTIRDIFNDVASKIQEIRNQASKISVNTNKKSKND